MLNNHSSSLLVNVDSSTSITCDCWDCWIGLRRLLRAGSSFLSHVAARRQQTIPIGSIFDERCEGYTETLVNSFSLRLPALQSDFCMLQDSKITETNLNCLLFAQTWSHGGDEEEEAQIWFSPCISVAVFSRYLTEHLCRRLRALKVAVCSTR